MERPPARAAPGFGLGRLTTWHRQSLSERLHMDAHQQRTTARAWLHQLGKGNCPTCPCRHHTQDRHHITFQYPIHATERCKIIGAREDDTWEALDHQIILRSRGLFQLSFHLPPLEGVTHFLSSHHVHTAREPGRLTVPSS